MSAQFWSKVDKSGDCWLWTGAKTKQRYGVLRVGGKLVLAHRFSYELVKPIPDGMILDHTCFNPSCVNPDHLRAVTRKQNSENRSRAIGGSGVRGVTWCKRKLKWKTQVRHSGKNYHAGYFTDLADAERAVIAKRIELFTHNDRDRV